MVAVGTLGQECGSATSPFHDWYMSRILGDVPCDGICFLFSVSQNEKKSGSREKGNDSRNVGRSSCERHREIKLRGSGLISLICGFRPDHAHGALTAASSVRTTPLSPSLTVDPQSKEILTNSGSTGREEGVLSRK